MDLKEIIKIVRARWASILLITCATVLIALGWTLLQPKVYTADASGVVSTAAAPNTNESNATLNYTTNTLASAKLPSYIELGSLRSVAEYAIEQLNLDTTPENLISQVRVTNPPETLFIRVTATGSTPEEARDLAEVWIRGMTREVNAMETGSPDQQGNLYLAPKDSARLPFSPTSPKMSLNLVVGFIGGLFISLAYILLRHFLDRKIRSVEDVENITGSTVLGAIPFEKALTSKSRLIVQPVAGQKSPQFFAVSEALRSLRTNIQFIDVDSPVRAVVVTSPLPGDGKSTVAANLALSIAMNDIPTVLIDADLRRPMQSSIFNVPSGAGLTDVLAGRATLEDVAHNVSDTGNLLFVAAGSVPPNPSEILGSARMKALIDELKEEAFIVIDAPPVIPVTDATVISARTDGAIIVTTVGKTTTDMLQKTLSILGKAKARALGVVLNQVPKRGVDAAYYGYQYRDNYYAASTNVEK